MSEHLTLKERFQSLQKQEIERARAWVYFAVYCGLITYLSHQPGDPTVVPPFPHFDKVIHFIEYFVFGVLLQRALMMQFREERALSPRSLIIAVMSFTAVFAALDEIHQYFVPFREMDFLDWLTDMVGAGFSLVIFRSALPAFRNRS